MERYNYKAKLIRVVDGDTIDALIDVGFDIWVKKRIRYKGIDTWESRTRDLDEKKKGLAAKARNKELLEKVSNKSRYFRIKSYGTGKYGRVLADIYIQDSDYNHIIEIISHKNKYCSKLLCSEKLSSLLKLMLLVAKPPRHL